MYKLITHEIAIIRATRTDIFLSLGFFLLVGLLFPLSVGMDPDLLPRIGIGVIWVAALLALFLSVDRIFRTDHEDGTLDLYATSPCGWGGVMLAKFAGFFITTAVPLLLITPLMMMLYHLPFTLIGQIYTALSLSLLVLSLLAMLGGSLVLGAKQPGLLVLLIIVPFAVPVIIFGGHAAQTGSQSSFALLTSLLLIMGVLAPFATKTALQSSVEE